MVLNTCIHTPSSERYLRFVYFTQDNQYLEHFPVNKKSSPRSPQIRIEVHRPSTTYLGYRIKDLVNNNSTGNYF